MQIDLVVRGICALRAGVPGCPTTSASAASSVATSSTPGSIRFGHGDGDGEPLYLIGSADWMPRNLDRRVEVLVPVDHPKHQAWLDHVFTTLLDDDVVRWELCPRRLMATTWSAAVPEGDAQERFYRWVADRQRR